MSLDTGAAPRISSNALLRGVDAVIDSATGFLFVAGATAMFAMVVTRYGFAWSDPSVEIIVRYAAIWGTFLGVSAGVRYGVNIRFTLVEHLFGGWGRRIFRTVALLVTLGIALALAVSGYSFLDETKLFNEVMPTSLRWPVWPFHAAIFGGGALLSLQVIRSIVDLWRPEDASDEDVADRGAI